MPPLLAPILAAFLGSMASQAGANIANKVIGVDGGGDAAAEAMKAFMEQNAEMRRKKAEEEAGGAAPTVQPTSLYDDPILQSFMEREMQQLPDPRLNPRVLAQFGGSRGGY